MDLKMSSGKWRPSCLGLNVLTISPGGQKTFEQLLEEQLRLEEAGHQSAPSSAPTGPARRTFLRRGEGIARFNSAPPRTGKAKKSGVSSGMARGPAGKKTAPAKMGSTAATMPNKVNLKGIC